MPLSTVDPVPALVVIDLQKGLAGIDGMDAVVAHAAQLARAFRARDLPVVLVNVTAAAPGRTDAGTRDLSGMPDDFAELMDELEAADGDVRVTKRVIGAFHGTDLDERLRERDVTQVVLAGVATSMGVEGTGRAAHEHGYHVVFATDAMTDREAAIHDHSVGTIFPRIGETATTAEVLRALGDEPGDA